MNDTLAGMFQKKIAVDILMSNGDEYGILHGAGGLGGVTGIYSEPHGVVVYTKTTMTVYPWANIASATFTRELTEGSQQAELRREEREGGLD